MRYKVNMAYDGRNYAGFQSQINATAIQDVIEEALYRIFSEKIRIVMSSRTDAGVHAIGQIAHFDTQSSIPPEKIFLALNVRLPNDIKVLKSEFIICSNL